MRFIKFAVLAALFALPVSSADAGIVFNSAVDFNFSNVPPANGLVDILGVTDINFGTQDALGGRIATNGTDVGVANGLIDVGDTTVVVGHTLIDQVSTTSGVVDPLDSTSASSFELSAVLRNVTGEIISIGGPIVANEFNGGFIDFYLDVAPETPFDADDLAFSIDDNLVGTFEVTGGQTTLGLPVINTQVIANLIDNPFGFFGLPGGDDPLAPGSNLIIEVVTVDEIIPSSPPFLNIDNGTGGVNIGPGFAPGTNFLDTVSQVDGNAQFGVVPEPSAALIWVGLGALAVTRKRRR